MGAATSERSVYAGTVTVDGDESVTLKTVSFSGLSTAQQTAVAKAIYNYTSTFNHVDIRVSGSFNDTNITIKTPVVVTVGNRTPVTFTTTTNYKWRIISKFDPATDYASTSNVLTVYNESTELTITKTEAWYLDGKKVGYDEVKGYKAQDRVYNFTVDWTLGNETGTETGKASTPTSTIR